MELRGNLGEKNTRTQKKSPKKDRGVAEVFFWGFFLGPSVFLKKIARVAIHEDEPKNHKAKIARVGIHKNFGKNKHEDPKKIPKKDRGIAEVFFWGFFLGPSVFLQKIA